MNIVAIDTVTPVLSVTAVGPQGKATIILEANSQHAEKIITVLEQAMGLVGLDPLTIDLVAVPQGPGSFTGLRIAYSAAKGLQAAAECALYPVPTLDCYAAGSVDFKGAVVPLLDAKKGRFYAKVFRSGEAVTTDLDIEARELTSYLDLEETVLFTGPDAALFNDEFSGLYPHMRTLVRPSGEKGISPVLAEFALSGRRFYTQDMPDHAGPVYVRKSDAELGSPHA